MRPTAYRRNARGLRDRQAFEAVRMQAGALFAAGRSQAEVARTLGVARQNVSRWHARWQAGGLNALASRGPTGPDPRLSQAQRAAIDQALRQGARAHGFDTDHWTLERITTVIQRLTGTRYHPGHTWKLLRRMGWRLQRPARRATERDEQAIARWVAEDWPYRGSPVPVTGTDGARIRVFLAVRSAIPGEKGEWCPHMLSAWGPSGAVSSVPVLARIWPEFSAEQVWGFIHGIGFGGLYLLLVGYGVVGLVSFRRRFLTPEGIRDRVFRLKWGFAILAALTWATVWTGTYLVYPEYRAMTKTSPRSVLLADEATATWHTFFMEFKEHSAFFAAFLATSVAIIAWYYGSDLVRNRRVRYLALGMHLLAFAFAGLAALFGAWITGVAPVGVPLGQGG